MIHQLLCGVSAAAITASLGGGEAATGNMKIPAGSVSETLFGFPYAIMLDSLPDEFWSETANDGADLRVAQNGEQVPTDLVVIDTTSRTGILFAKIDISSNADTLLDITWGSGAGRPANTSPIGRHAVWSDYECVVIPDGGFEDRTGKTAPGSGTGTPVFQTPTGINPSLAGGGEAVFTGAEEFEIAVPNVSTMAGVYTLSVSYRPGSGAQMTLINYNDGTTDYTALVLDNGDNPGVWDNDNAWQTAGQNFSYTTNDWHRVSAAYNAAVERRLVSDGKILVDTTVADRSGEGYNTLGVGATLGSEPMVGGIGWYYLRAEALSSEWLRFEYEMLLWPSLVPVGGQELALGTNINFATGDGTGWTVGAGWSVVAEATRNIDILPFYPGTYMLLAGITPGDTAVQDIDMAAYAAFIDMGGAFVQMPTAIIDDWGGDDAGLAQIEFLDEADVVLETLSTGQIAPNPAGVWIERFLTGEVPVGTRSLRVTLQSFLIGGGSELNIAMNVKALTLFLPATEAHRYWRIEWGFKDVDNIQMAEIEFRSEIGGPDRTGSGTILFSSQFNSTGFKAANAFDNDPATPFAHTGAIPNWIGYDFGGPIAVVEIMLQVTQNFPAQNSDGFVVAHSDDGLEWTPYSAIHVPWSAPVANETKTYAVVDDLAGEPDLSGLDPHRYWRVLTTQQGRINNFTAINNFALLDAAGVDLVVSAGGAGSADEEQGGFPASNAFDQNDTTQWATNSSPEPHWLQWDFGAGNEQVVTAYKLKVYSTSDESMPTGWKLQCSDDGAAWKTLDWQHSVPTWGTSEERTFEIVPPATADFYLRYWGMAIEPLETVSRPRGGRYASFNGGGGYFSNSGAAPSGRDGVYMGWGNNSTMFKFEPQVDLFFALHAFQISSGDNAVRIAFYDGATGVAPIEIFVDAFAGTFGLNVDNVAVITGQDISALGLSLSTWFWISGHVKIDGANSELVLRINDTEIHNDTFATTAGAVSGIAPKQTSSFGSPPNYTNLIVHDGRGFAPFNDILTDDGWDVGVIRPNVSTVSEWSSNLGGQYVQLSELRAGIEASGYLWTLDGVSETRMGFGAFDPTGKDVLAVQPTIAGWVNANGAGTGNKARMTLHLEGADVFEDFTFTTSSTNLSLDSFAVYRPALGDPTLADVEVSLLPVNGEETMGVTQVTIEILTRASL